MSEARPFRSLTPREQAGSLARSFLGLLPFLVAAFGFLLTTIPFFPPIALVPDIGLALVYLFSLYRPTQLPVWTTVPLGVIADALLGYPMGAHALALPILALAVEYVDTLSKRTNWVLDWLLFVPFMALAEVMLWLFCRFAGPEVPLSPFMTQGLATVAVFPFVAFLFVSFQRNFVDRVFR